MQKFDKTTINDIFAAVKQRREVEFYVEKSATGFDGQNTPDDWTAYPPAALRDEDYAQILLHAGTGVEGAITTLEIAVHLGGGRILYKQYNADDVAMKVTWPSAQ